MPLLEIVLGGILLLWCGMGVLNFWDTRGIEVLQPDQATEPFPTAPRVSPSSFRPATRKKPFLRRNFSTPPLL
jgi:hypothetical protein